MSVKIIYKDIAPGAKDDINDIQVSDINDNLSNIDLLRNEENQMVHYATLEYNHWKLDGTYRGLTLDCTPFISTKISKDTPTQLTVEDTNITTYQFDTPISITRIFNGKYESVGISFTFSDPDYCNYLRVQWYNDDDIVYDNYYYPNSSEYYCKQNVDVFNKITVTFYGMNKANRFLKIFAIDDGVNRIYTDNDIISINILEEMSLVSEDLKINSLDFSILHEDEDVNLMFQKKQPISVYLDNVLLGMFFIDEGTRTSKNIYEVSANDYKGILDVNTFYGGLYNEVLAGDIIKDIFKNEDIPLEIDINTANTLLSGYLPICTKREALVQVLMATCSVCTTARTNKFKIMKLPTITTDIPADRIMMGGSVKNTTKVTSVKITIHNYVKKSESQELYKGTLLRGDNIVQFSNPCDVSANVTISGGTLKELYTNYCIINVDSDSEITVTGYIYEDNTTEKEMTDPNALTGKASEVREITDCTLISNLNYEVVLKNVYDYYMLNSSLESDIVILDEQVGDFVTLHTQWSGDKQGRIEQLDYDIKNKKIGKVVQRIYG